MKPDFSYKEIVRLTVAGGYSQREIASSANCSTGTVSNVQSRMRSLGIDDDTALSMNENELRGLLGGNRGRTSDQNYIQPDFAAIDEQLSNHRGLTLTILWEEYAKRCADAGKQAYMYSFFSQRYREWKSASDLSLRIAHIPGDKMEVDWAGTTMEYVDMFTGDVRTLYLFVATLPFSQYTFVKPIESMDSDSWITCNIAALKFFGGVPRIIVPDNLRTGVDAHTPDEVRVNRTYREFGEHYGTAIIPTGVRKPKQKASVEGNVGKIGERIILMLRNMRFFSADEVEQAVSEKLDELNARPFKKRTDGSRTEVFFAKEKHMLASLPATDFEPGRWVKRTVSPDYRISVDASTYTVPYAFANQPVDVRVGRKCVEVFCDGERIATHPKASARGSDVKQKSHQPKWHTDFLEQSGERFRQRAKEEIGPWGFKVVEAMLAAGKVEEEGYRPSAQLLNLAARHGKDSVEAACKRACSIAKSPSLKTVKILLKSQPKQDEQQQALKDYAILHEEDYYTGAADGSVEQNMEGETL